MNKRQQQDTERGFDTKEYWDELIGAMEHGETKTVPNFKRVRRELAAAARETRTATKQISIRVNAADLARLRAESIRTGIPYQTLINSILHRHAMGQQR
ncbi:hypothetical protein FJY93_05120 [Candidatus Kaiserbacteria bacterium]|nr:hypothetical protein [Candidatus Kaiserbacteria bacterium]